MRYILVLCIIIKSSDYLFSQLVLNKGEVIDKVYCKEDTLQSYALYLPSDYAEDRKWPVIFVFEPAARGPLPVHQYKLVAEELGYIIISSNNSRNGSWDVALSAANAMFTDAASKFKIDSARIYTSGFSGGSRIAVSLAVINDEIDGVIGCGAGLSSVPLYQPQVHHDFVYVGIVGNRDMNYLEHIRLEQLLDDLSIANNRIVFDGKHQWPPANVLREAVFWLEYQAHERGERINEKFKSKVLLDRQLFRGDSLHKKECLVEALNVYEQVISDFNDDENMQLIKDRLEVIRNSKELKKAAKRSKKLLEGEEKLQSEIISAFSEIAQTRLQPSYDSSAKTKLWWVKKIDSLHISSKNKNIDKRHSALRSLNLIWAKFAEASFSYENFKDFDMAILLTEIWLHADPENIWGLWSMAKLHAKTGNTDKSIDYLWMAYAAGMKYRSSLQAPEFDKLRTDPRFKELEAQLEEPKQ
ncbi:hypothetical protein [Ekhidna sp.]|uniref:TPR end-of-group domain-containing protein n=1 Tax=Ekhidna sp. TaxID=2608089 RepID=UPI003519B331